MTTAENPGAVSGGTRGKRGALIRRYRKLEQDRTSWRSHWMEISDYLEPRRGRYLIESQTTRGRKRSTKIVDSTGTQALRTMAAGMMSGMTSPARPWHRRKFADEDLMDRGDVRDWLAKVEEVERGILHRSNFYNTVSTVYRELGAFGTAPLYRQPHRSRIIHFRPFTAGEYVIAENDLGAVDTLGREFTMTVAQIVKKFVWPGTNRERMRWDRVSMSIKRLWDKGNYDELVTIIHLIEPRALAQRDLGKRDQINMPVRSVYFEPANAKPDQVLQEGGYRKMPAYVPRWDVLGGDIYGRSPGMDTLGDVKQLQHEQKRKAQAIDKMVNPPMTAPTSLRGKPSSVLPGHTTYVDQSAQGAQGFAPAYLVQPRLAELQQDIAEVQERIQRGFYADLFAMMINSDRREMTATEVAERHEEKLVLLGPVLQRLNVELLDPLLDDVHDFAWEAGMLPDPPAVVEDQELEAEYISLLAQAQQAVAARSIERALSFTGNLTAVYPDVKDNIDEDKAVRKYGEVLGVPADIIRDADEVANMREGRSQELAQQKSMEQAQAAAPIAQAGADAAKVLSETDAGTGAPNALAALLQGVG